MLRSVAGRRYAQALLDIAQAGGGAQLDQWASQLNDVASVLANSQLARTLVTPSVPVETKQSLVSAALEQAVPALDPILKNLTRLLISRGRSHIAGAVAAEFAVMVNDRRGVTTAEVITAVELTETQRRDLGQVLSLATNRQVTMQTQVDPRIVGGVIIRLGDREVDASITGRLAALRRQLAG